MSSASILPIASGVAGNRSLAIPLYKTHIPASAASAIDRVLQSGQIAGDGQLPEFERKLREFLGAPHLAATAEFSRSVEMALRMAGVGPGDSVLLSPLACLATTMPILQVGARPIWCDIEMDTGCLNPNEILRNCSVRTKAVLLYHWVGVPGDIKRVLDIATQANLKVIEDAGEALGAEYDGVRIGAHGCDYTVFSFSPVRHITTGEGAAMTFRDASQHALALLWRRYGIPLAEFRDSLGEIRSECDITVPGFHNYMNRFAGAIGELQLGCLPDIINAHRRNGELLAKDLAGIPGVRLLKPKQNSIPSYWVYCFLCEGRDALLRKLRQAGIYASKVHMRNDAYSCFSSTVGDLPNVTEFERNELCIPCGWWVTDEDREYMISTIREGW
jgi:perosamine synthetase